MYNQHDHTHCWVKDNPPCGQKIKHFECCLCKKEHPEIEAERQKREEVVERIEKKLVALSWQEKNETPEAINIIHEIREALTQPNNPK